MNKTEELAEILDANYDLKQRLAALPVSASYDEESNTLLLTIGKPQRALTEEIQGSIQLRLAPASLKIVGFEVALGF